MQGLVKTQQFVLYITTVTLIDIYAFFCVLKLF
jgi:hypothetical protein